MWHLKETNGDRTLDVRVKKKDDLPRLLAETLKNVPETPTSTVNIQIVFRTPPIPPQAKKAV